MDLPWTGDRVRFMEQASFGPNAALELRLRRIGYTVWLEEQMDESNFLNFTYPDLPLQPTTPSMTCDGDPMPMDNPLSCFATTTRCIPCRAGSTGSSTTRIVQLRRRASWSLGQIFVTSGRSITQPSRMLPYIQF